MLTIEFILPYKQLGKTVDQFIESTTFDEPIRFIQIAKKHSELASTDLKGDILIARGLTVTYLNNLLKDSFIVVGLPMSGYDILRAIQEGTKRVPNAKRVGLCVTQTIIDEFLNYKLEIGIEVQTYPIGVDTHFCDIEGEIRRDGIDFIIGGDCICEEANDNGIPGFVIQVGRESIRNAVEQALNLYHAKRDQLLRDSRIETVLETIDEGIISCDANKCITLCNNSAQEIIGIPYNEVIGKKLSSIEALFDRPPFETLKEPEKQNIMTLSGTEVVVNRSPVLVDDVFVAGVISIQRVSNFQNLEPRLKQYQRRGLTATYTFRDIIGESRAITEVKQLGLNFAKVNSNVLIVGDTGTGKEMFAQSIHNASSRKDKPFVAVNCAAFPDSILESELFGYVEGAFTGAKKSGKAGIFELADTGTIFLDEISEMSLALQGRILRVIEERKIMRIGDDKLIPVDIRVIVATNKNLPKLVEENRFRKDLYYRLNVLCISLPSLRERISDIPLLMNHFMLHFDSETGLVRHMLDPEIFPILQAYPWKGNIRQLRNLCERLSTSKFESIIRKADILQFLDRDSENIDQLPSQIQNSAERDRILESLRRHDGNRSRVAEELKMARSTLYRKMMLYGLQ
ncbi:MAG: sigma 54-interacting transcriptional regulator [Spirochaetales bacterium]|nr:sigma 54-interacting transcriptional regulator [Spirochaetales bacterium]